MRVFGVFAHREFALIWFANFAALVGVAMYDAASGWMIMSLGPDPRWVSMLRAAVNLPMVLVTLSAGAIADIFDARRVLIGASAAIAALVAVFAFLVAFDLAGRGLLLATSFLLSGAISLTAPAWLAVAPRLVPTRELPGVMAANGIAYNLSRAIGPALGGFAINRLGASAPFAFLVAANLAVWWALARWTPPPPPGSSVPAERLSSAIRIGLRHTINNRPFLVTIVRTIAIYPFAAAYWGLLPLVAGRVSSEASFYGELLSVLSVGTIVGSFVQRSLRGRIGDDEIVALGSLMTAIALGGFAIARAWPLLMLASSRRGGRLGDGAGEPLCGGRAHARRLGASARTCGVPHRGVRRDDDGQRGLGLYRPLAGAGIRARRRGRRRFGRHSVELAVEDECRHESRSLALWPLARCRRRARRSRTVAARCSSRSTIRSIPTRRAGVSARDG